MVKVMPNFSKENMDCTESLTCAQPPLQWQHPSHSSQHSKGTESTVIGLFSNWKISKSSLALSFHPPISVALALCPQYIAVITAQKQMSLNYFLERPPLYVIRGDPDGDGTLGHILP